MDQNKPWLNEPDELYWKEKGLRCSMQRNMSKTWCGYVEIPEGHPYYDIDYWDINKKEDFPEIHGGLSFRGICNDGEYIMVGFDCSRKGDLTPSVQAFRENHPDLVSLPQNIKDIIHETFSGYLIYRDVEFVKKEITKLVDHIVEVGTRSF